MDALISGRLGVALLFDGASLFSLHVEQPNEIVTREPSEIPYLLRQTADLELIEGVQTEDVLSYLEAARQRESGLEKALSIVDHRLPSDLRRELIDEFEEFLEDDLRRRLVEDVLYAHPLPDTADAESAMSICQTMNAPRTLEFLRQLVEFQPFIASVRRNWKAISRVDFGGESDFQHWQAVAVRAGLFRTMVKAVTEKSSMRAYFLEAIEQPAVRKLPNALRILRQWIHPLVSNFEGRAQQTKDAIKQAISAGDIQSAREHAVDLLATHQNHGEDRLGAETLCGIAQYAQRLGFVELQLQLIEDCIQTQPAQGWIWAQYGHALLHNGREDEANRAYREAREGDLPFDGRRGQAETLMEVNRIEDALKLYEECLAEQPDELELKIGRARALRKAARLEEALQVLNRTISEHPNSGAAREARAGVLNELGRREEAQGELRVLAGRHGDDLIRMLDQRKARVEKGESHLAFLAKHVSRAQALSKPMFFRNLEALEERDVDSAALDLAIRDYLLRNPDEEDS